MMREQTQILAPLVVRISNCRSAASPRESGLISAGTPQVGFARAKPTWIAVGLRFANPTYGYPYPVSILEE